tara:strand:- start:660 stop:953 length:294 start_codon:yes stop_codon:yes gene_type:complete
MATTPPTITEVKKTRAPKKSYGFAADATIIVAKGDGVPKYSGQRLDWFEKLQKFDGKTVKEFMTAYEGKDSPRGWLRFFATKKVVKLVKLQGVTKAA